ncbi:MAG: pseudaminic acid synthase [Chthoniobacterales bacterium]
MSGTLAITIQNRRIATDEPMFIIAELSANHNQDLSKAKELIATAAEAGADAVKLQTYTADSITLDCDAAPFRIGKGTIWEGRTLHSLYSEAYTPWEWHGELFAEAKRHGLIVFSSPFDFAAVDLLESLHAPAYKIASFEIVDIPLLKRVAATGKPVIMSTGMATLDEIDEAVQTLRSEGVKEIALLKCTSGYPADPAEMNLRTLPALQTTFNVPVGLSDHTLSNTAAVASRALDACILEKHLTLSRKEPGPDSAFSLEPQEFADLVKEIRLTEAALGSVRFEPTAGELASRKFRRSLFVTADIKKGEAFTADNVRSIRPADGLHPRYLNSVIGATATSDIARGTPLEEKHFSTKCQ